MTRMAFSIVRSRAIVLDRENVDTDQIVPARFLTGTRRDGFERALFADWRFDTTGAPRPDSPLDQAGYAGRQILVAGRNFGCGSSREHAVWALAEWGFRAVIAPRLADIFRRNALQNGLLALEVEAEEHAAILAAAAADLVLEIDLPANTIRLGERAILFVLEPFARLRLLQGMDDIDFLLAVEEQIAAFEAARPPSDQITSGVGR